MAHKWPLIGTCLNVQQSEIEAIECRNLSAKDALRKLICRWLDTTEHTVTWYDIISALREPILKEMRVAKEVEDHISSPSSEFTTGDRDLKCSNVDLSVYILKFGGITFCEK